MVPEFFNLCSLAIMGTFAKNRFFRKLPVCCDRVWFFGKRVLFYVILPTLIKNPYYVIYIILYPQTYSDVFILMSYICFNSESTALKKNYGNFPHCWQPVNLNINTTSARL